MREKIGARLQYNITGGIPRLIGVSLEKDEQTKRTKGASVLLRLDFLSFSLCILVSER